MCKSNETDDNIRALNCLMQEHFTRLGVANAVHWGARYNVSEAKAIYHQLLVPPVDHSREAYETRDAAWMEVEAAKRREDDAEARIRAVESDIDFTKGELYTELPFLESVNDDDA